VLEDVAGVKVLTTLSALLLVVSTSATAGRGIANIRVTPAMSLEPANVVLEVAVQRHADNRLLMVTVDSGEFYWSSERQLEGQDAPYLSVFMCKELPAGEYEVQVSIIGSDGKVRGRASNRILVVSRDGGP
jgi:methionine-rich copper-binding protein CopC